MTIKKVTIAGGGVLGAQIAYATAFHGYDVIIWGRRDDSIERIKPRIDRLHEIYKGELELLHILKRKILISLNHFLFQKKK